MKHLIRDFCVFIFSITGITFWYRHKISKQGPLVRVVAFHDVDDVVWFEKIIKTLITEFHMLTPEEFHLGILKPDTVNMLVTFDDGYASWVQVCLPILQRYHVKALFFINSGLLDVAGNDAQLSKYVQDELRLTPKAPLTWKSAEELRAAGNTFGGHTVHHQSLATLTEEKVCAEVSEDKASIERALHVALEDFAYPFGTWRDYTDATETCVRSCGYIYVYTAESGFVRTLDTHIPRTLIEKNQSPRLVRRWMYGGFDVFVRCKRALGR